ncbi:SRPBCC family protein [Streptosporangium sp. NPDC049046]|uniref:SRPBCC family protein n=1 Tax=unclassified Streptosporangium TaxID=2632669 RepID=UPI00342F1FF0
MKKRLRLLAAQLLATALVLTTLSAPAHASTPESDPQLAAEWQSAWDTYEFYKNTPPLPESGRSRAQDSISITIDAPVARVLPAYSNINNHLGMHSFLKRVVTHKDRWQGGKRHIDFTAVEEIPYEGSTVVINTHAQQRIDYATLSYETDSWTMPNVVTHQKIVFKQLSGGKTKVTEYLTFDADSTLIDFVLQNGVASHEATQAAMKQAIESGEL